MIYAVAIGGLALLLAAAVILLPFARPYPRPIGRAAGLAFTLSYAAYMIWLFQIARSAA